MKTPLGYSLAQLGAARCHYIILESIYVFETSLSLAVLDVGSHYHAYYNLSLLKCELLFLSLYRALSIT
jgi:hypothetical protein